MVVAVVHELELLFLLLCESGKAIQGHVEGLCF